MPAGNDFAKAFETLENWFDSEPFRVNGMTDDLVAELAATIGCPDSRPDIGRWLTSMDRNLYTVGDGRILEVVAIEFADGSRPGLYQIRHHEEPADRVITEGAMTLEDAPWP